MLRITRISTTVAETFRLEGRICGSSVEELRRQCATLFERNGVPHVVFDLGGVSFIDNEGVELFRDLCRRNVVLTSYSPFVGELLKEVLPC
jgi:anti-anti-sigma regulatory factor